MSVVGVLFLAPSTVEQRQDKQADTLNPLPSLDVKASSITGYHLDNPGVLYVWMRLKNCLFEGGGNLPQALKKATGKLLLSSTMKGTECHQWAHL